METDQKIRQSIRENVKGTTILIAHRITTLMNADQIWCWTAAGWRSWAPTSSSSAKRASTSAIYDMQGVAPRGKDANGA